MSQPNFMNMSKNGKKRKFLVDNAFQVRFFYSFFNCFEISVKFSVFSQTEVYKNVWLLLALCPNFEAKHTENGSKYRKKVCFFINVSWISFGVHKWVSMIM